MPAWLWIALLWAGFAGTHLVMSSALLRPRLVARLGNGPFRGLYSLAVLSWFVALVGVFARHKHAGPVLWYTVGAPAIAEPVNFVLMLLAFALVVAGLIPSQAAPSSMGAPAQRPAAHGVLRITRHPFNAGASLFGLAHLLVNGALGDVLFFGGFPLFAGSARATRTSGSRGTRPAIASSSPTPRSSPSPPSCRGASGSSRASCLGEGSRPVSSSPPPCATGTARCSDPDAGGHCASRRGSAVTTTPGTCFTSWRVTAARRAGSAGRTSPHSAGSGGTRRPARCRSDGTGSAAVGPMQRAQRQSLAEFNEITKYP